MVLTELAERVATFGEFLEWEEGERNVSEVRAESGAPTQSISFFAGMMKLKF